MLQTRLFYTVTILSLKNVYGHSDAKSLKQFIIMTASCTACSKCTIVIKVIKDNTILYQIHKFLPYRMHCIVCLHVPVPSRAFTYNRLSRARELRRAITVT